MAPTNNTWAPSYGKSDNSNTVVGKQPIVSEKVMDIILYVGHDVLTTPVCIFGIVSNIINIIIFIKQGFKNTVNISLFGIALSDLGAVICLQWVNICNTPLLRYADLPFVGEEIQYLTGGIPHVMFTRNTSWFIAFVTIERCLSVVSPLKVRQLITPTRTAIALVAMFMISFLSFFPEYFVSFMGPKFYKDKNMTLMGVIYSADSGLGNIMFIITPLCGLISLIVVVVFTVILVVQLRRKSKWRKSATGDKNQAGALSTRDKNTMKMVILLSTLLIVCNIPGTITTSATFFESDIRPDGSAYARLFKVLWVFPFFFQAINASVNIFFYYRMSTNYRETFDKLFASCMRKV